ncbi:MAG TPA: IS5 family transposase [Rhabdochlamydiaceae bacterium]
MLQKNPESTGQSDLYRQRLENIIDMRHGLVKLAGVVDWTRLEADFKPYYHDFGRPGGSIRLMTGLMLLKDMKGLSDEEVCAVWRENPYFQFFCGEEFFQHRLPVEPPSLSIFRKRVGERGMERLLQETIRVGLETGTIAEKDFLRVTVDTTVQEKAVHFPTDVRLCHKAREELVKTAEDHGVALRQSYVRKSKHALFMANKYLAARQMNRGRKKIREVRNYLGRVIRDIERAMAVTPEFGDIFKDDLARAKIIFNQTNNPQAPEKIYSWHAPEVECVAKGKSHKKYEFGCKASLASTNKGNFIVGAMAHHGRPYDGTTLSVVLQQIEKLTGVQPKEGHVDLGYRGHGIKEEDTEIILSRQKRGITPAKRMRQKRRNAIEPIIGHCKNDRKIGPRNWLKGKTGDKINVFSMAIGFNLRKILRQIFLRLFYQVLLWLRIEKDQILYA